MLIKITKDFIRNPKVKDDYLQNYPDDEDGKYLNGDITYLDLFLAMIGGKDFYSVIGYSDSVIRERIFDMLSDTLGIAYDDIYNLWTDNELNQQTITA